METKGAQDERSKVLNRKFIESVLHDPKQLSKNLVDLTNVINRDTTDSTIFYAEVEPIFPILIRPEVLGSSNPTIRMILGTCLASIFQKIDVHDFPYLQDEQLMQTILDIFLKSSAMAYTETPTGLSAKALLGRLSSHRILTHWTHVPNFWNDTIDTFFSLMTKLDDDVVAVTMSQIMIDCLASTTPVNQEAVEYLLMKLCWDEEADVEVEEESEDSDDDELMAHTQEAPEEKKKKEMKKMSQEHIEKLRLAEQLALDVLKGSARIVEPAIGLALQGESKTSRSQTLHQFYFVLVSKLNALQPSLINRILPDMANHVVDPEASVRLEALETLIPVFLTPYYSQACLDFANVFFPFTGRMRDNEPHIRLLMIDFAQQYLLKNVAQKGLDDVASALAQRLSDRDTRVRTAAIQAYQHIAADPQGLDKIEIIPALKEIALRALDKVESVRFVAAQTLGFIYRKGVEKLIQAMEDVADTKEKPISRASSVVSTQTDGTPDLSRTVSLPHMAKEAAHSLVVWQQRFEDFYASIPSIIIHRYSSKELNFEERGFIDNFISQDLFKHSNSVILDHLRTLGELKQNHSQSSSKSKEKGNGTPKKSSATTATSGATAMGRHIILVVSGLTSAGKAGFLKWMEEKKAMRDEVKNALAKSDDGFRHAFVEVFEKRMGKIGKVEVNAAIKQHLAALVNTRSMEKRVHNSVEALLRNIKKSALPTMQQISNKLYLNFFSTGVAQEWISLLSSLSKSSKSPVVDKEVVPIYTALCGDYPSSELQMTTTTDLLLRSAAIHTGYFGTLLKDLDELLSVSKDAKIKQAVARISSLTASLMTENNDEIQREQIRSLQKMAEGSDSKTAAEAGVALNALFSASDESVAEAESFIDAKLKIIMGEVNERVPAALATLTPLVKLFTSAKALKLVNRIVDIVREAFESKPKTQLSNKTKGNPAEFSTPITCAAVEGLQFAISWFRHIANAAMMTAASPKSQHTQANGKKSAPASPFTKTPRAKKAGKSAAAPTSPNRAVFKMTKEQSSTMDDLTALLRDVIDAEHNDLDHVWLRATAITGVLRLVEFRAYDDLFDLIFYLRMSDIMMDSELPSLIASEIRATLVPSLMAVHRLPLKYLPFAVVLAEERPPLAPLIEVRRNWVKVKLASQMGTGASDSQLTRVMSSYLPEYALPWLIFVLAHSAYLENDAPKYKRTWEYLVHFLSALLQVSNFDFIYQMLEDIRQLTDALEPESHNIHLVAELGLQVIAALRASDSKLRRVDGSASMDARKVLLPNALFKPRLNTDEKGNSTIVVSSRLPSFLPSNFVPPFKKLSSVSAPSSSGANASGDLHRSPIKRTSKTKAKRSANRMELESHSDSSNHNSDTDEEMAFSSDEEGIKRNTRKTKETASKHSSLPTTPKKPTKTNTVSPKRTTPSRKAKEVSYLDQFEESSSSSSASSSDSESLPIKAKRAAQSPTPTKKNAKLASAAKEDKQDSGLDSSSDSESIVSKPKKTATSPKPTKKAGTKASSAKKASESDSDVETEVEPKTPSSRAKRTVASLSSEKKSAKKTGSLKTDHSAQDSESSDSELPPSRSKRGSTSRAGSAKKGGKKSTVAKKLEESDSSFSELPPSRPKRQAPTTLAETKRGKMTAASRAEDEEEEAVLPPAKRAKRGASTESSTPASSTVPVRRNTRKRGLEEKDEAVEEMEAPTPKRAKRGEATTVSSSKSKSATKKKKEEEMAASEEEEEEAPSTPARRTRRAVQAAEEEPTPSKKKLTRSTRK